MNCFLLASLVLMLVIANADLTRSQWYRGRHGGRHRQNQQQDQRQYYDQNGNVRSDEGYRRWWCRYYGNPSMKRCQEPQSTTGMMTSTTGMPSSEMMSSSSDMMMSSSGMMMSSSSETMPSTSEMPSSTMAAMMPTSTSAAA